MRLTSLLAAISIGLALGAATAAPALAQPRPGAIARLERARAASPRNAAVLLALGIAYHKTGRHAEARAILARALDLAPRDGTTALYLGLSAEAEGDAAAARAAYASYLAHGRTRALRRRIAARLAVLERSELARVAREAIAREGELASEPGSPRTIAVPALTYHGADSTLRPLERGLADLLITDLGRSRELTVVERQHVQALLDEIALAQSARADSATALRAGRMVRAGRVVQGAITELPGGALRVDAAVVDVPTATAVGGASADDRLEQLFAIEKRIVFGLFDALGVRLTPAERALVDRRPTRSIAAFVAYSSGLLAEDEGRLDEADRHYREALRLDPGFARARERGAAVSAMSGGDGGSAAAIEYDVPGTLEGAIAAAAERGLTRDESGLAERGSLAGTLAATRESVNPSPLALAIGGILDASTPPAIKDPASSATNTDNPIAGTGTIVIVIRQPK